MLDKVEYCQILSDDIIHCMILLESLQKMSPFAPVVRLAIYSPLILKRQQQVAHRRASSPQTGYYPAH